MELDEMNPVALIFGLIGAGVGWFMISRMSGAEYSIGIVWKVLTPIATGFACYLVVNKIASD